LKEKLSLLGYLLDDDEGIFGLTTREAVMTFQQACGLPADGIVREQTWRALYALTGGNASAEFGRDEEIAAVLGNRTGPGSVQRFEARFLNVIRGGKNHPPPSPAAKEVNCTKGTARYVKYVVQPGDTLTKLSKRFHTTPQILADLNHLQPLSMIFPGDVIMIPE
jgi:hypothetical protein